MPTIPELSDHGWYKMILKLLHTKMDQQIYNFHQAITTKNKNKTNKEHKRIPEFHYNQGQHRLNVILTLERHKRHNIRRTKYSI